VTLTFYLFSLKIGSHDRELVLNICALIKVYIPLRFWNCRIRGPVARQRASP